MNRRAFLASIPLLPAAAKAVCATPVPYKLTFGIESRMMTLQSVGALVYPWLQTTRTIMCRSLDYDDTISAIMIKDPVERRRDFNDRRRPIFKRKLAEQLAMPAPNLP